MKRLAACLASVADCVWPRRCAVCGGMLAGAEESICSLCLSKMPRTHMLRTAANRMEAMFMAAPEFSEAAAIYSYSPGNTVAAVIHDFKYNHRPRLAEEMGRIMARTIVMSGAMADVDVILPVPLHAMKRARRGYNQTVRLATGFSEIAGIPIAANLYARRPHSSQTGRTAAQRKANTSGVFAVRHPEQLLGRHILLIDDVCTTGATLNACADTIRTSLEFFVARSGTSVASDHGNTPATSVPAIPGDDGLRPALSTGLFRFSVLTLALASSH